jgi:hypothetical protein
MRNSFPSEIYFVLRSTVWVALAQATAEKQNLQLRQPIVPSYERNESLTRVIEQLTLANHAASLPGS